MARKRPEIDVKAEMYDRAKWLYVVFFVAGLVVTLRLIWVIFLSNEISVNAEKLEQRIFVHDTIQPLRGSILARGGEPLATSIQRYRIDFDMGSEGFDSLELFSYHADSLAEMLNLFFRDRSQAEYYKALMNARNNCIKITHVRDSLAMREGLLERLWDAVTNAELQKIPIYDTVRNHRPVNILPRAVDFHEWQTLKTFPILNWNMGMTYRREPVDQRVYPYGEMARRTIGRITDNVSKEDMANKRGQYGLENIYSQELTGTVGIQLRQRIAPGFSTLVHRGDSIDAEDGLDVVTTLDVDLQHFADAALRRQLTAERAIWGTAIVMDVETGDILALANLGETAEQSGVYYEKDNYAFNRRIEPGSTFKLASLLALTEDCKLPITQCYDANEGRPTYIGHQTAKVQDDHDCGGVIDMKTATAQSSNVYFARAIYENYNSDRERYVKFLREKLHLGEDVGFTNMEEKTPLIRNPKDKNQWNASTLPNMGYGYAIDLPPIRMAVLYNAVANGGKMVAPRLVKELRRGDKVVQDFPVKVMDKQICSPEALKIVHECLVETARTGTTKSFFKDSTVFRVASKTGTAKVAQRGDGGGARYSDGYYMGTVAAYFPADKPKYTILTSIFTNRKTRRSYYGATLAGPVVRDITNYIYYRDEEWHQQVQESQKRNYPHHVKGGNIANVRRVADKFSPRVSFNSREGWGEARTDTLLNVNIKSFDNTAVMPNVVGMGLKDALYILESRGLKVNFSGSGTVRSQSIRAGEPIASAKSVTITLR
ncbi:MAG: transpeptidase family protein [Alistipes sp.]|nr:transpeptidase family protein [Alistipes sp.]